MRIPGKPARDRPNDVLTRGLRHPGKIGNALKSPDEMTLYFRLHQDGGALS